MNPPSFSLDNKTARLAGASRGIGPPEIPAFGKAGAQVVITGWRSEAGSDTGADHGGESQDRGAGRGMLRRRTASSATAKRSAPRSIW